MMIIKYRRVSTDEQANTGHSLRTQNDTLDRYIEQNNYTVALDILDDFSGKTFNRPGFNQLMQFVNTNRGQKYTLIFTRWDRFGRTDFDDAYSMVKKLRKKGVELICLEQPVNLDKAEDLLMLAIYLTTPKVEWLNIQSRIRKGMNTARLGGQYVGPCPFGYEWLYDPAHKKCLISPHPVNKNIVKEAFEIIKRGGTVPDVIEHFRKHKKYNTRAGIYKLLRNPVYAGKVPIKELDKVVRGNHLPLVSETLFNEAQDVLDGKSRKAYKKNIEFELKGMILCSVCGKLLTASNSKSRSGLKYGYYHCTDTKHDRFRSETLHQTMSGVIRCLKMSQSAQSFYNKIVNEVFEREFAKQTTYLSNYKHKSSEANKKLKQIDDLLLSDQITPSDYNRLKTTIMDQVNEFDIHIAKLQASDRGYRKALKEGISTAANFSNQYESASVLEKKQILSAIFPDKLRYENDRFRTTRMNSVMKMFITPTAAFRGILFDDSQEKTAVVSLGGGYNTNFEHFTADLMLLTNAGKGLAAWRV